MLEGALVPDCVDDALPVGVRVSEALGVGVRVAGALLVAERVPDALGVVVWLAVQLTVFDVLGLGVEV